MSRPDPQRSWRFVAGIALLLTAITTVATSTLNSSPVRAAVTCGSETLMGSGSLADPFRVSTSAQLAAIGTGACTLSSVYMQEADLTLTGPWTPIGSDATPFTGTYIGASHSISGMAITGVNFLGMFAAANGATIRDLNLSGTVSATTSTSRYIGMLVGAATSSAIAGVTVTATVSASLASGIALVGGVIGNAYDVTASAVTMTGSVNAPGGGEVGGIIGNAGGVTTVTSSVNHASVTGRDGVGGIVGDSGDTADIIHLIAVTNTGTIRSGSSADDIGGILGDHDARAGTLDRLVNTGNVSGDDNLGGLIGLAAQDVTITNSSSVGSVSGDDDVGGLIGDADAAVAISGSTVAGTINGTGDSAGGLVGITGGVATLDNTSVSATVFGDGDYIGGFIGEAARDVTITDGRHDGITQGVGVDSDRVGGLIGYLLGAATIASSTVTGTVTGTDDYIGGFIGASDTDDVTITNSLRNGTTRGVGGDSDEVGGLIGMGDYVTVSATTVIGEVSGAGTGSNIGGLIGRVDAGSSRVLIEHVTRSGANEGDYDVGGLIGEADGDLVIIHSSVSGTVIARDRTVGGLIGYVDNVATSNVSIVDSSSSADVEAQTGGIAGGLIGDVDSAASTTVIRRSSAHGDVLGVGSEVGGLIGSVLSPATTTIEYSVASGSVTGSDQVGGLVGHATSAQFSLADSYALGDVTATAGIAGGAIGSVTDGAITRVYARGGVQGTGGSGGLIGVAATSTTSASFFNSNAAGTATSAAGVDADLSTMATFSNSGWAIVAGWSQFSAPGQVWGICRNVNSASPYLLWEYGDNACTTPLPPTWYPVVPALQQVTGDEPADEASVAAAVSQLIDYASAVYLVSRDAPADGLVAAAAGARAGRPVLITDRDTVPRSTLDEIERLGVVRIVLVGGNQRISGAVESVLRARFPTVGLERLAGEDRTTTAIDVTNRQFANGFPTVYLAASNAPADAVIAATQGAPLLYTERDAVPETTLEELRRLAPERIVLVGGPARIAESVRNQLRDTFAQAEVMRLGGADRYETAALLADPTRTQVMLIDGRLDRVDSIAAAATARITNRTLLLSGRTCAPESTLRLLQDRSVLTVGIVGIQACS